MAAPETETTQETSQTNNENETLDVETPLRLQFSWTFWYAPPHVDSSQKEWGRHKTLIDVHTVQEFWRVFNNLVAPSNMPEGSDLHFFRLNVQPEWEDQYNAQGGTLTLFLPVTNFEEQGELADAVWVSLLMNIIGDCFDDADEICGITISKRTKKPFKFALWIKTASDAGARKRIAKNFRSFTHTDSTVKIKYMSHDDQKSRGKKKAKIY